MTVHDVMICNRDGGWIWTCSCGGGPSLAFFTAQRCGQDADRHILLTAGADKRSGDDA